MVTTHRCDHGGHTAYPFMGNVSMYYDVKNIRDLEEKLFIVVNTERF